MSARRRYHTHIPGAIFTIATLLLGVGAYNSQNNLLFLFFGIAIAAMVASGVISGAMLTNLRAERAAAPSVSPGQHAAIRYRLINASRVVPAFAITIEEEQPDPQGAVLEPASAFAPHVPPGGESLAVAHPRAIRRGVARLSRITLTSRFPFGFMRKSIALDAPAEVLVHPSIRALRPDALTGIARINTADEHVDDTRGSGGDFYALREYSPGDAFTRIAWRASARHDTLLIREETRVGGAAYDLRLILDADAPEPLNEKAISLAASLAELAVRSAATVSLAVPAADLSLPRGGTPAHLRRILDALARLDTHAIERDAAHDDTHELGTAANTIAVHASGVDPARAPARARHLHADDLDRLAADVRARQSTAGDDA